MKRRTDLILGVGLACCLGLLGTAMARPIVVFNQDTTNFTITHSDDDMCEAGLLKYLDGVIGKGAFTHFFICPNAQTVCVDTKVWSPSWWRSKDKKWQGQNTDCARRDLMMHEKGIDVINVYIKGCRAKGVSPWLSMRMNDSHCGDDPAWWGHSKFWVDNPKFRNGGGFNFKFKEVRDYHVAFVQEMLERYDVDGFECDWMRFPLWQQKADINDVMGRVYKIVKAAEKKWGHRILLGARVHTRPQTALNLGMDFETWAKNGWIDWLVPCNFFCSVDFGLPIADWKQRMQALGAGHVKVIPGLDTGVHEKGGPWRRMMTKSEYCGWADKMYKGGAEGVYLFNLFTYFEEPYHCTTVEPYTFIVNNSLTPESIKNEPKSIPAGWILE